MERVRVNKPRILVSLVAAAALLGIVCLAGSTPSSTSGYLAKITNSTNTEATAQYFSCTAAEAADSASAYFQYYLNEPTGSTVAQDSSTGADPGTYQGSMTSSTTAPLACSRDTGGAYVLNGTTSYISTATQFTNPTTFSIEVWFKTTIAAGKLIGWGSSQTGQSGQYDRHLYIETTGKLDFGTYNGAIQVLSTPGTVTDGKWHQAVGTMSPATGMRLYLDGVLVASNAAYTTPENDSGYWRVGYDNINGWKNNGNQYYFTGQLRYAAAYPIVLTATQIQNHYTAGQ